MRPGELSALPMRKPRSGKTSEVLQRLDLLEPRLSASGFRGTVTLDAASRAASSTDNSVYQIMPLAIIAPRDAADVSVLTRVLDEDCFSDLSITPRGGGTGTNGQSLNSGLIIDFRRYMNRVLAIDVAGGFVDVEPGIVLDDLNRELAKVGMFFGPNTSTSNRCTIGGMVSTDASGKGSRIFGKTSDNVLGMELVIGGGRILDSLGPPPEWAGPMMQEIATACDAGLAPLLKNVPRLSRRFTGLDLERARPCDSPLEWWRLPIGAEGILGLVTRVRLRIVPAFKRSVLLVLGFDSFAAVLDATQKLLVTEPLAIEVMDEWVQELAQRAGLLDVLPSTLRGDADRKPVYAFVEFAGEDLDAITRTAEDCMAKAERISGFQAAHLATDRAEIAHLWSVRAASVGLLGATKGERRPISFVEDCVVPPENLSAFVADFSAILKGYGLDYGIYGHADVGCLHTRPALDVANLEDRVLYKKVSDDVFRAASRHGGIFWGEHGKGIRGEYLEEFVGQEAFAAFKRIKRAFDPKGRFNPGKLVSPDHPLYGIGSTNFRITKTVSGDPFKDAYECNGNALCLNYSAKTPMCPSFKVTSELRHSPKGRAEALRAWRLAKLQPEPDHALEQDVFAALDGCLGCKSCAGACPTHVDIPEMKSRFLSDYHQRHRRRLSDHVALMLEAFSPFLERCGPLVSRLLPKSLYSGFANLAGIVDPPVLSPRSVRRLVGNGAEIVSVSAAGADVLLLQDPFTTLFDADAVADIVAGLRALRLEPELLPLVPPGKAAHVKGDRRRFERQARKIVLRVTDASKRGVPIVGLDPSLVYMFRSEFVKIGMGEIPRVYALEEFLLDIAIPDLRTPGPDLQGAPAMVFLHCTEKSMRPKSGADWMTALARLGINAKLAETGCCGMSGLFGHEKRHQDWSRSLYDMSWRETVDAQDIIYATGFSCRSQVKRLAGKQVRHPMALVADAFKRNQNKI